MILIMGLMWFGQQIFSKNVPSYASYFIPSSSMAPTLQVGDFVMTRNHQQHKASTIQRGDVIVFRYPNNPKIRYISRVVALPADEVTFSDGTLSINGQEQPLIKEAEYNDYDHYLEYIQQHPHHGQFAHHPSQRNHMKGHFIVPDAQYFVMSDNRDHALDGRMWQINNPKADNPWGFLPQQNIMGKALFIWMNSDCLTEQTHCDRIGRMIQ